MELRAGGSAAPPPPPLRCLLLGALLAWPGAAAQVAGGLQVLQPQDEVSVSTGTTLTLQCTVLEDKVAGPIKWLKDSGGRNETVYDQKGSGHRATRIVNSSDTNYDISISNVQVEDAGTYYCVKFKKGDYQDEVFLWGKGTKVLVNASPVDVAVSGPTQRAEPGSKARFTCSARGFFPADIRVRWLKNGYTVPAPKALVFEEPPGSSFAMSSALELTLAPSDVRTQLSCEVSHSTLSAALRRTYNVSDALRVPPMVRLLAKPSSTVEVNKTVNLSCSAEGFYPNSLSLTWLENGLELPAEAASPAPTAQGTFELQSSLAVQAALERNQSVIACRVVHDAQSPVSRSVTLHVTLPPERGAADPSADGKGYLTFIYIAVGVICTVLALLVVAVLYLIRMKQSKGKSSPSVRLHEPDKNSGTATQESDSRYLAQESDANNLTYADLNFEKEKKSIRRIVEMSQQSEYACIQTSQAPAADENLTYADLDMVHLSKAPKRPAPRPEEAGSEYASVQIQRK